MKFFAAAILAIVVLTFVTAEEGNNFSAISVNCVRQSTRDRTVIFSSFLK
jgi:hypothetical protein